MSFEITAVTAGFPSEFVAPGAGAFDFPSKISLAVLRRQDLALYLNSGNQALCLNDCTQEGNTLTQLEPLDLPASSGGFSIVIHNRGALGVSADIGAHVQLRGYVPSHICGAVSMRHLVSTALIHFRQGWLIIERVASYDT